MVRHLERVKLNAAFRSNYMHYKAAIKKPHLEIQANSLLNEVFLSSDEMKHVSEAVQRYCPKVAVFFIYYTSEVRSVEHKAWFETENKQFGEAFDYFSEVLKKSCDQATKTANWLQTFYIPSDSKKESLILLVSQQ